MLDVLPLRFEFPMLKESFLEDLSRFLSLEIEFFSECPCR